MLSLRRAMRVRCACWSLTVALVFDAGSLRAEPTLDLNWAAPDSCPSEESVRLIVAQWIARSPETLDIGSVHARARVRLEESVWRLEVEVDSPGGISRETLSAARCEALAQVVALKMALAAMPVESLPRDEPARAPSRPRSGTPGEPPSPAKPPKATFWGVRAMGGLTANALPNVAGTVGAIGSASVSSIRMELGAVYLFPQRVEYDDIPGVGATFELVGGTARVCPTAVFRSLEIPVCAGVQAGVLRAAGFGVAEAKTANEFFLAGVFGPALVLPVAPDLKVWVEADGMLGIVRPAYRMRNLPRLHRLEAAAVQLWAGLEYRFE